MLQRGEIVLQIRTLPGPLSTALNLRSPEVCRIAIYLNSQDKEKPVRYFSYSEKLLRYFSYSEKLVRYFSNATALKHQKVDSSDFRTNKWSNAERCSPWKNGSISIHKEFN